MPHLTDSVINRFYRAGKALSTKKSHTPQRTPRPTPVSSGLRCFPLRLGPGVELVSTVHELMDDLGIRSLIILSCVGTLSQCSVGSKQLKKSPYEIVSLTGTFDSESHHLMGSFADPQTGSMIGGRVSSLLVDSTCELMLAETLDCTFTREFDPRTGNKELVIRQKRIDEL